MSPNPHLKQSPLSSQISTTAADPTCPDAPNAAMISHLSFLCIVNLMNLINLSVFLLSFHASIHRRMQQQQWQRCGL
jgi:hypothetical protein